MQWLAENWIWIALIGGMAAMHLFGHGHGGHHGGRGSQSEDRRDHSPDDGPSTSAGA